jgi:hypothetical protein
LIIDFARVISFYNKNLYRYLTDEFLGSWEKKHKDKLKLRDLKKENIMKTKITNEKTYKKRLKGRLELEL